MDKKVDLGVDLETKKLVVELVKPNEFFFHDELIQKGILSIDEDIQEDIYESFKRHLLWLVTKNSIDNIDVYVCSSGGSLFHSLAIFDLIRLVTKKYKVNINTIGLGYLASGAGIIFQAGTKRLVTSNTMYMIHEVTSFKMGDEQTSKIEDEIKVLRKMQEKMIDIYCERSTLTPKDVKKNWERKDWWLSAEEILNLKLADEVIDTKIGN